jgi:hypothetical protein
MQFENETDTSKPPLFDFDKARAERGRQPSYRQPVMYTSETLADLNLEHELVRQFNVVRGMQDDVLSDPDVPANQKAQVANAVASTIKQLVETQEKYYNQERLKKIEAGLIKVLGKLPAEAAAEFLDIYEKELA